MLKRVSLNSMLGVFHWCEIEGRSVTSAGPKLKFVLRGPISVRWLLHPLACYRVRYCECIRALADRWGMNGFENPQLMLCRLQ